VPVRRSLPTRPGHPRARSFLAVGATALLAVGCTVKGPNYARPHVALPATMPGAPVPSSPKLFTTTSTDAWRSWWSVFKDPELDRLVAQTRASNLDLRAALDRVRAARAVVRGVRSPLFPQVFGDAGYARQKNSTETQSGQGSNDSYDQWSASGDVAWEIDLFGKTARSVEAACADAAALEEDRRALELVLVADVAQTWFDVGAARAEVDIAKDTARLLEETLGLVKAKYDAGLTTELDLRRTEGDLASARALIPEGERRSAVGEHRLAILMGQPPGSHFDAKPPAAFQIPPEVPVGLPATLLERRPDVRAAEMRLVASNARVGQAIAEFYPSVTLFGRIATSSVDAATVFDPNALAWSIGPSVHIPIFEGGRLAAQRFQREAERDAATAAYAQVIYGALGEVADAVTGVSARLASRDRQKEAVEAATKSVELSNLAYEKGITGYVNVLDGQRALAVARLALLNAQRLVLADLVRLGKALGGGWETGSGAWAAPSGAHAPAFAAPAGGAAHVPSPRAAPATGATSAPSPTVPASPAPATVPPPGAPAAPAAPVPSSTPK